MISKFWTSMSLSKERLSRMYCLVVATSSSSLHEDHRVERIDGGHQQRLRVPVVMSFREWLQVVVSPGVFLVAIPGVEELGFYFSGEFLVWLLRGDGRGRSSSRSRAGSEF